MCSAWWFVKWVREWSYSWILEWPASFARILPLRSSSKSSLACKRSACSLMRRSFDLPNFSSFQSLYSIIAVSLLTFLLSSANFLILPHGSLFYSLASCWTSINLDLSSSSTRPLSSLILTTAAKNCHFLNKNFICIFLWVSIGLLFLSASSSYSRRTRSISYSADSLSMVALSSANASALSLSS